MILRYASPELQSMVPAQSKLSEVVNCRVPHVNGRGGLVTSLTINLAIRSLILSTAHTTGFLCNSPLSNVLVATLDCLYSTSEQGTVGTGTQNHAKL